MNFRHENFLSLSRKQPSLFSTQLTFDIDAHTLATIHAPGIISFEPIQTAQGSSTTGNSKSILLSSGVHGNETAPIEICDRLVQEILAGTIQSPHRIMFIFGNLESMDIAKRFVDENLNRLFDANNRSLSECLNIEQVRAQIIKNCVTEFFALDNKKPTAHANSQRFHYDLHTAIRESKNQKFAVYPFLHGEALSKRQLRFLSACDVNTVLLSQSPTGTFSYYTSFNFFTHGFTVELGKVKPFGENDMTEFTAVDDMLRSLLMQIDLDLPEWEECPIEVFEVSQVINKKTDEFILHFSDSLPNFTDFKKGDIIATDGDTTFHASQDGEAIVFPNANVEIGQRAVLTVIPALESGLSFLSSEED
jgi:succinylglutamate desuccinylase